MAFVSKAKWFEYGEKSNKFFLNLNKCRQNQKLISEIKNGETTAKGQEKVTSTIADFYKQLYKKNEVQNETDDNDFYKHCPKLTSEQKAFMDEHLTLNDLWNALATCQDSSPGPDGISYGIYKKLWDITGPIILNSWNHSLETGIMPRSHLESVITILPKDGKDLSDIKNWRPITLTNCDAKIITKALAMKISRVLESIIDPSQTAYVKGRSVMDNLRANFFYKNYCLKNNIDAVLVSLDAKKAFDSVDHKYIEETLAEYGFGAVFITMFKILYKDLTARIMVNGFFSEAIKIERGVKQGDALSCAIFIICIDPLIRNINANQLIKKIRVVTPSKSTRTDINFKAAAYADDISVICRYDQQSIQAIFSEYERLTKKSGLELNADKTEILLLNNLNRQHVKIQYNNEEFEVQTISKIKICGLYYSLTEEEEHKLNVEDKITKLTMKIRIWSHRYLTMEGKILIVKTFGLSQIIYNMQCYKFEQTDLKTIEREIFQFLWSTKDNKKGIDRLKRSVMKSDFAEGGMKVTDPDCLDRALKLRQFVRAGKSNHAIKIIQALLSAKNDQTPQLQHEYYPVTDAEHICEAAQETLNMITDYNRVEYNKLEKEEFENDKNLIEEVSMINIEKYLKRKKKVFHLCIAKNVIKNGITTLGGMTQIQEYDNDEEFQKSIRMIMTVFPPILKAIAGCIQDEADNGDDNHELRYLRLERNTVKEINNVTVKELQVLLKKVQNKTENYDFNAKLDIQSFDTNNILKFRKNCKNPKLRNIYFRLIHNDFFTRVKMKKYNMVDSDDCLRCGNTETLKHLIWDCSHAKIIWSYYNELMCKTNNADENVKEYSNIFIACDKPSSNLIKIRIIQELIQMERPRNWSKDKFNTTIKEIINLEKYNFTVRKEEVKFIVKWGSFEKVVI
jgi:hypothetical protein